MITISLVLVFLGLGSCQVRKSFQILLDGSANKEQTHKPLSSAKGLLAKMCSGSKSSFNQKLSIPGSTSSIIPPLSSALFFDSFLDYLFSFLGEEDNFRPKALALIRYNAVPFYLKNRSLLI